MALFGKSEKVWEAWRTRGRMIDFHKTKVAIIEGAEEREPIWQFPLWFIEEMQNAVSDGSCNRDLAEPVQVQEEQVQQLFFEESSGEAFSLALVNTMHPT